MFSKQIFQSFLSSIMEIYSAQQIREWDNYTIQHEPISSLDLIERASKFFTEWFVDKFNVPNQKVTVICGNGNNASDALAIARMLHRKFYEVEVLLFPFEKKGSDEFNANLKKLPKEIKTLKINLKKFHQ